MSSSSGSTVEQSDYPAWGHCGGCFGRNANWSITNIAAMLLGFVFFWPVGLVVLFWIASGRNALELPGAIRHLWQRGMGQWKGGFGLNSAEHSENVVFNAYQQTQYDRIREIKDEIKERANRFHEFRADAKRRADEEEFNRFMSAAPVRHEGK